MKSILRLFLALGMPIGIVLTYKVSDAPKFPNPELARMIFYHLPCALSCSVFLFFAAPYFSWRYLRTRESHWDHRAAAAMELGVWLGVLTLVTGMLFAKYQWGAWWNWDPRQTSFLLVMLIAFAYFAIRSAFTDRERRAANSAAYEMATLLPSLFLFFVFPKLAQVFSLHPNLLQNGGGMDAPYRSTFLFMFALVGVFCVGLYQARVRVALLEESLENNDAKLANRDHPAVTGVVRPVSVRAQD